MRPRLPRFSVLASSRTRVRSSPVMLLNRKQWFQRLFPDGVPQLWCPPLTHYNADGQIDERRIRAHLRFLSPWVRALLVPGSTGDGWELTSEEANRVVQIALAVARELRQQVLLGALHPDAGEARRTIQSGVSRWQLLSGPGAGPEAFNLQPRVCGFAVCPPRGEALTQEEIGADLRRILSLGMPTAVYQLPQITRNEMSSVLLAELADEFPNFILFKDTSGADRVAQAGVNLGGVFLVRGMEGDYARWLKAAGGPYDGFLLSAANYFPRELSEVIRLVQAGRITEAQELSRRVSQVVNEVFAAAKPIPDGNVFANAGKALDHFFAHGPAAPKVSPPRLHSGRFLPMQLIEAAGAALRQGELLPSRGYLEVD